MEPRTFVISLPRSHRRRELIDATLKKAGIQYEVWTAFDGAKGASKGDPLVKASVSWLCRNRLTCTNGVIGCYISHVALWRHIACGPTGWSLVLEDDALPECKGHRLLQRLQQVVERLTPTTDIVNLSDPSCYDPACTSDPAPEPAPYMITTCAYMISKDGANNMLRVMDHAIHYHVDFVISAHILMRHVSVFRSRPALFRQNNVLQSTVSTRTFPSGLSRLFGDALRPALSSAVVGIGGIYINVSLLLYCLVVLLMPNRKSRLIALALIVMIELTFAWHSMPAGHR